MAAKSPEAFSASSTRLTLSKNSAQSTSDISRMLVMMLRTVTLEAPWRWCSSCTTRSVSRLPGAQLVLEPQQRRRDLGILVAQALHELHGERRRELAERRFQSMQRIRHRRAAR